MIPTAVCIELALTVRAAQKRALSYLTSTPTTSKHSASFTSIELSSTGRRNHGYVNAAHLSSVFSIQYAACGFAL